MDLLSLILPVQTPNGTQTQVDDNLYQLRNCLLMPISQHFFLPILSPDHLCWKFFEA